jgi:hypothetical protein
MPSESGNFTEKEFADECKGKNPRPTTANCSGEWELLQRAFSTLGGVYLVQHEAPSA